MRNQTSRERGTDFTHNVPGYPALQYELLWYPSSTKELHVKLRVISNIGGYTSGTFIVPSKYICGALHQCQVFNSGRYISQVPPG